MLGHRPRRCLLSRSKALLFLENWQLENISTDVPENNYNIVLTDMGDANFVVACDDVDEGSLSFLTHHLVDQNIV